MACSPRVILATLIKKENITNKCLYDCYVVIIPKNFRKVKFLLEYSNPIFHQFFPNDSRLQFFGDPLIHL